MSSPPKEPIRRAALWGHVAVACLWPAAAPAQPSLPNASLIERYEMHPLPATDGAPDMPDADAAALAASIGPLGDISLGSPDARVTVVEFSSLTCGYSAAFRLDVFPILFKDYVKPGKVRWIVREYASDEVSRSAFQVARCANRANPLPYIDGMFRRQSDFLKAPDLRLSQAATSARATPREALAALAATFGMDATAYAACLDDKELRAGLEKSTATAVRAFKVKETPSFFVDGKALTGAPQLEDFRALIDAELAIR